MYTKEYFLLNPEFIRWIRSPDEDLDIYWTNWLEANPDSFQALKEAKELVSGIKFGERIPGEGLKSLILSEILKESDDISKSQDIKKKKVWVRFSQVINIAAILALGLLLSWFVQIQDTEQQLQDNVAYTEKIASIGEKLSFSLPDGTRVWLNSNSSLVFPSSFEDSTRTVELNGEGYFEVAKDKNKPFKVVTNSSITTALGTSFNINNKADGEVKISLISGIVSISDNEMSIHQEILKPNEQILINKSAKIYAIKTFETASIIAWKEGRLIFENNTFDEVMLKLVEWYGVEFTFENTNNVNWDFSGEYKNQSLELVLKSMSYIEDFEFEIKDKQVLIKF